MLFLFAVIFIVFFIGGWKYESMKSPEQQAEDRQEARENLTAFAVGSALACVDILNDDDK